MAGVVYIMKSYFVKRLLYLLPVMLGVTFFTFIMIDFTPGDPAEIILTKQGIEEITPEMLTVTRERMGLDGPLHRRYFHWLGRVTSGDLGYSFNNGEPVLKEIVSRIPATVELAAGGLLVMLITAIPLGILAALFPRTIWDHGSRFIALGGASIPSFYLGLLLIHYLAVPIDFFPVMGREGLKHLLLPSFTLGFGMAATYARLIRAGMLEVLDQDYIRSARARGLREATVVVSHALRNALIPLITLFGLTIGGLLGGTLIVEQVFAYPGLGRMAIRAIFDRDIPIIQGYVLMMSMTFVFLNLLVDISYRLVDPRVRLGKNGGEQ